MAEAFETKEMNVRGETFYPHTSGALYWPKEATLIVADLHFEKATSFAPRGLTLPPYDTRSTLRKLSQVMEELKPTRVITLGDSFHDMQAAGRMSDADKDKLHVPADSVGSYHVYVSADIEPDRPRDITFKIVDEAGTMSDEYTSVFITRKD